MWVLFLGQEDPLEEELVTHSVFLPGEPHGQRSLGVHGLESNPGSSLQTSQAPCLAVCRPCGFFRMMHGGGLLPPKTEQGPSYQATWFFAIYQVVRPRQ